MALGLARLPFGPALRQFLVGEFHVDGALDGVDRDDVAVLEQPDRAAHGRLRPDMADAEAAGRAGEAAVGDERDLVAHALAVERRRGREHLAHAGAAARALVADDENLAFLVLALGDGLEAGLLAVEAAGRAAEDLLVGRHARDLHDGAFGREVALAGPRRRRSAVIGLLAGRPRPDRRSISRMRGSRPWCGRSRSCSRRA